MPHQLGLKLFTLALWSAAASQAVLAAEEGAIELVADGLDFPSDFAVPPDESGRVFIADYHVGKVLVLKNGELQPTPFLNMQDTLEAEREIARGVTGLISLAFPPDFPDEKHFYVTYTGKNNKLVLSRFAVSEDETQAMRSTEEIILTAENWRGEHYCGHLEFGPEGLLYLCIGDSGLSGMTQNLGIINGVILRLDVEDGGEGYAIPHDNPFVGVNNIRPEIWVYGVRNPWRFSFDSISGDLYVPDPGGRPWEELNVLRKDSAGGSNLGWPLAHGNECRGDQCVGDDLKWPVYTYLYGDRGCSIIGGVVLRGEMYGYWNGVYIFSDFCTADIWAIKDVHAQPKIRKIFSGGGMGDPRSTANVHGSVAGPTAVGVGPNGRILITDGPGGSVYQLRLPTDFESGWEDISELQLRDLLSVERNGSGWVNERLRGILDGARWRWTQPLADLYRFVRRWLE